METYGCLFGCLQLLCTVSRHKTPFVCLVASDERKVPQKLKLPPLCLQNIKEASRRTCCKAASGRQTLDETMFSCEEGRCEGRGLLLLRVVPLAVLVLQRLESGLIAKSGRIMFRRKHASHFNADDDEHQEAKINELRAALGPLSARGAKYCTEACLRRYLQARNWNLEKSRKMLEESLKWRATYKPEEIRWPEISVEAETGKMYRAGFQDREGRTVVVMKPAKQNTMSPEGQMRFLVYVLENAILNLPEGQEQMVWLIDFTGWTLATATPIKTARESANILQNHYPERLAIAFLYNPPKVFEAFWKVIRYFLDPKSVQKVNFVYPKNEESLKVMHKHIDPDILPEEFGGKNSAVFDHEEFSKVMLRDDIKTASFWGLDEKPGHANGVPNGHSDSEVTPS